MVSPALYPSITGAGSFAMSDKMVGTFMENTVTVTVSEPPNRSVGGTVALGSMSSLMV